MSDSKAKPKQHDDSVPSDCYTAFKERFHDLINQESDLVVERIKPNRESYLAGYLDAMEMAKLIFGWSCEGAENEETSNAV